MENLQLALMKAAMCGGAVSVAAVAVIFLWPQLAGTCRVVRKRPVWERVLIAWLVAVLIAYGGSKPGDGTNEVENVENVEEVEEVEEVGGTNEVGVVLCSPSPFTFTTTTPTVTPEDIARGWRLWEVRTNADWSAAMPEGAALCTNWWLRGAYEDCSIVRLGDCSRIGIGDQGSGISGWRFPFGSNEWDSAWAYTWGKLRFALRDRATEIAAVGAPMSAVPFHSRLWAAADTNGSRLVTWENFTLGRVPAANYHLPSTNYQLPTTNYQLVSAQIELRRNGDFVTRSNEVETVCRRIESFDWDGDGLVNELDAAPYAYDGDCFGQGEGWVRANFTNADEIVQAGGYKSWAWGKVGRDLENGYYVLSAFVEDERTVRLDVGDMSVVATNAGEYVFLLEKGVRYDLGFEPSDADVWYDAADDAAQRPMMTSAPRLGVTASGGWEGAAWRGDEGYLVLNPPPYYWPWYVLWLPRLYVTPMTWQPTDTTPTETFTAEFADVTGSFAPSGFSWWGEEHLVSIDSPSAQSTQITSIWHGHGDAPYMHVTANVAGEEMTAVFYTEHVHDSENFGLSLSVPDTLFVDDDDDDNDGVMDCGELDEMNDDVDFCHIGFTSSVRTNGTISIESIVGACLELVDEDGGGPVVAGDSWELNDAFGLHKALRISGYSQSGGFESGEVKVRWTPSIGPAVTAVRSVTVVRPVAQPICTEWVTVGDTRKVLNPCGIVIGGDSVFRVGVEPSSCPDDMIAWQCVGAGSVEFPDGNTGREVRVRGVSAGRVELRVHIGDCSASAPSFSAMVVAPRTVRLSAWIIADKDGMQSRTEASVRALVAEANEIYSQVGVVLDLGDRITVTNIPAAYNITVTNEVDGMWNFERLSSEGREANVVTCYFVNSIADNDESDAAESGTVGLYRGGALAVSPAGTGVVFAHEIGHHFGMRDIYNSFKIGGRRIYVQGLARYSYESDDWNNGCVCSAGMPGSERYYATGTTQDALIGRMLMNGNVEMNTAEREPGFDITCGSVYGYDRNGELGDVNTGFFHGTASE